MNDELARRVDPAHTTILSMEMQRGIVGDLARFAGPAEAVRESGILARCAALYAAGRGAGLRVVHCNAAFRPDRAGSYRNMPFVNRLLDDPGHLPVGTPAVAPVPELMGEGDLESTRLHGISPFAGTDLDSILRSLGTRTVVAAGVSLNRGIIGISIEAVNHGYEVVVPRDAVIGYPREYGEMVLRHTLDGLVTLSSVDELAAIWRAGAR
ncbi:MAG: cysteine hydrolase family protein [Myxococcota bacterium]